MLCWLLQEGTRTGAIDPATAASLSASLMSGNTTPLDALTQALGMGTAAGAPPVVPGTLTHDYEFAAVELVKPTRMNKVGDCSRHALHYGLCSGLLVFVPCAARRVSMAWHSMA